AGTPRSAPGGRTGGAFAHADPASELPAVMVALEATLTLSGAKSKRTVPADGFFVGPLATALESRELLTEIRVPALPRGTGGAFVEMARRAPRLSPAGGAPPPPPPPR